MGVQVSPQQLSRMMDKGAKIEGTIPGLKTDFSLNQLHQPIWIPGHVPSSKNSRTNGQHNPPTERYIQATKGHYTDNAPLFRRKVEYLGLTPPFDVYFRFVRNSEKKMWDFINIAQIVCDRMNYYNWIDEDDYKTIRPHFLSPVFDKENPGVLIFI